jgi:hypothetical protein
VAVGVAVGAVVGAGVAVGVAVGLGVGVAVGSGVGVAVGFGVGVAVGSGVGVGVAWTPLAATTSNATDASGTPRSGDQRALPFRAAVIWTAERSCLPGFDDDGIVRRVWKVPRVATRDLGIPLIPPSQVSWRVEPTGKFEPVTMTRLPAAPVSGEVLTDGVVVSAFIAVNGTTSAARTSTMTAVAPQPPARDARVAGACLDPAPLGRAVARSSSSEWTQRVPSQNDNVILHSATRRTQGVPWLCGPASRRVCLFVDTRSGRGRNLGRGPGRARAGSGGACRVET